MNKEKQGVRGKNGVSSKRFQAIPSIETKMKVDWAGSVKRKYEKEKINVCLPSKTQFLLNGFPLWNIS